VAFGPLNLGATPAQARAIVSETLISLKLTGFEDRITYRLSGGEKRLVSLATVLAMKPEFLILDEPTTGLDDRTSEHLVQILLEADLSYMIISHDRDFMRQTTTKLLEMKCGGIRSADGKSLEP
jgi:cobalt/nickel transport system ATP-binding protein